MLLKPNIVLVFGLATCLATVAHGRGQYQRLKSSRNLKSSRTWISGNLMMKNGIYRSPDRQYYVDVYGSYTYGEKDISLYRGQPSLQPHPPHTDLLNTVDPGPVSGLVWLPGRQHTLVFASRGDPGYSMLGLWNGGRGVHMLHKVIHAELDDFKLYSVSRDGRTIIYGWQGWSNNGSEQEPLRKRFLRLPKVRLSAQHYPKPL